MLAILLFCLTTNKVAPFFPASSRKAGFYGFWLTHGMGNWGYQRWLPASARLAYREGQILARNWLKKGQKLAKMAQNFIFWKNWASFSLSPPQNWAEHPKLHIICHQLYISSIRNAKIRAMESNIPNGAILAIWRSKWRHINFRWRFVLGQVSVDTYWQLLQSFEKFRFWDWKIGLCPAP